MPDIIEGPPKADEPQAPLTHRLAWFFGLAISGTLATALVAYGLRALLRL
ncbi:MAG: hypothetical protein QE280_07340 [Caulobacter sp.]|jgi:hypothetical protein|nr:hypothetical protein [Caulobacter sp.]